MSLIRQPLKGVSATLWNVVMLFAALGAVIFDGGQNLSWHRGRPGRGLSERSKRVRMQALAGIAPSGGAESAVAERVLSLFEEFKATNDERLKKLVGDKPVDALIEEKLNRLNAAITANMTQHADETRTRLEEQEATINRLRLGAAGGATDETALRNEAAMFYSVVNAERGMRAVSPENVDLEAYRAYKGAMNAFLRRGTAGQPAVQNALQAGTESDGGVWVTPDMNGRLVTAIYETSPVRQVAAVTTISTDRLTGVIDAGEASLGGWVTERDTRSGDTGTPQLGTWEIPVHEQYAEPRATQILLDDAAVDVEAWLNGKVADKLSRTENTAFVAGNGVGKPRGFTTYTAGTPSATTWDRVQQVVSGSAAALTTGGLINLVFSVKQGYRQGAAFGMTRSSIAAVRKLVDGDGNYIWQPDFTKERGENVLGYPIVEMSDMPEIQADALPVVFANFGLAYQIVDRAGIRILRDPFTTKGYVKFYTTKRVGGGVINFEAIKLQKCST